MLKNTGLGYTVIRAGPLLEEPGGYKALIFDQVPAPFAINARHEMQHDNGVCVLTKQYTHHTYLAFSRWCCSLLMLVWSDHLQ